jgi:hypothetical protein
MSDVITRLAAANPVPTGAVVQEPAPLRLRPRRTALAVALAAAVAVPAIAFAGRLGDLFGLSNQGTPEPTSSLSLSQDSVLNEGMKDLGFPTTLQQLGTVNGVTFYASRRADGHYCFAIEKDGARGGISCDLDGTFPSPSTPVWIFPPYDGFNGYAADGVATVAGLDSSGATVVSVPVTNNLFAASPADYRNIARVEVFDAQGNVIWSRLLPGR